MQQHNTKPETGNIYTSIFCYDTERQHRFTHRQRMRFQLRGRYLRYDYGRAGHRPELGASGVLS